MEKVHKKKKKNIDISLPKSTLLSADEYIMKSLSLNTPNAMLWRCSSDVSESSDVGFDEISVPLSKAEQIRKWKGPVVPE